MFSLSVSTSDYHIAGEPFRIVPDPAVVLPGDCVADRRARALHSPAAHDLRKLLCFEPRGHADMYGSLCRKRVWARKCLSVCRRFRHREHHDDERARQKTKLRS